MKTEKIIRFWRFAYLEFFDMNGYIVNEKDRYWKVDEHIIFAKNIFWRFYWIVSIDKF